MGVLDNTSVTVDAILTKKGREKLAKGEGQFLITKFALGDDEIDYNLYDVTHPNGSNFYGEAIENMNLLEAVPDQNLSLRYKLTDTIPGSQGTYVMNATPANTILDDQRTSVTITPTISGYDGATSYSFTTGGDSNISTYLSFSINTTTGALEINRTNAPDTQKIYIFEISEENSLTSAPIEIKLLASGAVPQ